MAAFPNQRDGMGEASTHAILNHLTGDQISDGFTVCYQN